MSSEISSGRLAAGARLPSSRTLAQVEREHIETTLQATKWVLGGWDGAAARLGLSRTTLISRMQRLGISAGTGLGKSVGQHSRGLRTERGDNRRALADGMTSPVAIDVRTSSTE